MFLLSQSDLAHDGVLALRERRWARLAAGLTVADVQKGIVELSASGFVVVDEDTEELLIRSFIRRDKVYRQPNVLRAAADHLPLVSSPLIRCALLTELRRVAGEPMAESSAAIVAEMVETLTVILNASPIGGTGNPSENPSSGTSGEASAHRRTFKDSPAMREQGKQDIDTRPQPPTGVSAGEKASDNPSGEATPGTPGEWGVVTAVSSGFPDPHSPDSAKPSASSAQERAKRGTRIPADFTVTPQMVTWAREKAPNVDGRLETEKFVNYWQAKSGKDATKVDWAATWRNWILTASEHVLARPPSAANKLRGQNTRDGSINYDDESLWSFR